LIKKNNQIEKTDEEIMIEVDKCLFLYQAHLGIEGNGNIHFQITTLFNM